MTFIIINRLLISVNFAQHELVFVIVSAFVIKILEFVNLSVVLLIVIITIPNVLNKMLLVCQCLLFSNDCLFTLTVSLIN